MRFSAIKACAALASWTLVLAVSLSKLDSPEELPDNLLCGLARSRFFPPVRVKPEARLETANSSRKLPLWMPLSFPEQFPPLASSPSRHLRQFFAEE